jgi:benzoyl-CoA reductase subunit C
MAIDKLIAEYKEIFDESPLAPAAKWKANHPGSKVVGCYPVYTPVELIHAAGMLPIGIIGGGNRIEIAHADSRFQSFVCSIVKSTLELLSLIQSDAADE